MGVVNNTSSVTVSKLSQYVAGEKLRTAKVAGVIEL